MVALTSSRPAEASACSHSLSELERLIASLPAEQRAQATWAFPTLRDALRSFLNGPRDDQSLRPVLRAMCVMFAELGKVAMATIARPEVTVAVMTSAALKDLARVQARIDPVSGDSAEWAFRTWIALGQLSLRIDPTVLATELPDAMAELGDATNPAVAEYETSPASPLRLQVLLMATVESMQIELPAEVTAELAVHAGDTARMAVDVLRQHGLRIEPFEGESTAARAARTKRYARHLRQMLTDEDHVAIETSRLGSLR